MARVEYVDEASSGEVVQTAFERMRAKRGKAKPTVPAWEDVLLGVRSSGDR